VGLKLQNLSSQGPSENIQEHLGCAKIWLHEVIRSHPVILLDTREEKRREEKRREEKKREEKRREE
jgi:hypothetical protein